MRVRKCLRSCVITSFAMIAILLASSGAHAADILADNLDKSFTGHTNLNNTQWPSQRFTTTANGFMISEIQLLVTLHPSPVES